MSCSPCKGIASTLFFFISSLLYRKPTMTIKNEKLTILTLCLLATAGLMPIAVIALSIPSMSEHFAYIENADLLVKMGATLPFLSIAIFAPIGGHLIDTWGRLGLLKLGIVGFSIFGAMPFFVDDIYLILGLRFVFGIFASLVMTVSSTLDRKSVV